jgi:hypothetical protein
MLHCCSIEPTMVPGGDDTSICFTTQDNYVGFEDFEAGSGISRHAVHWKIK